MSKRVLIVGGQGYLGRHLVNSAPRDARICTLSRQTIKSKPNHFAADIGNKAALAEIFNTYQPQWVINCAASGVQLGAGRDGVEAMSSVNHLGALNIAQLCASSPSVERLLHIGSCFEYGNRSGAICETAPLRPTTQYGETKAAGTLAVLESCVNKAVCVARMFSLWGRDEPAHRIFPQVTAAAKKQRRLELTACEQLRDYIHVSDAARILWALLAHKYFGEDALVNVAAGDHRSLRAYAQSLNKVLGGQGQLVFDALPYRPGEMMSLLADVRCLQRYALAAPRPFEEHAREYSEVP